MRKFLFITLLLSASVCISQSTPAQSQTELQNAEKTVEWINIKVPVYPPIARTAHVYGTIAIEVQFKGCELDASSPNILSGPPLLRQAAMEALKQSTIRCGDFSDSRATIYYEFKLLSEEKNCRENNPHVEVLGNKVRIEGVACALYSNDSSSAGSGM